VNCRVVWFYADANKLREWNRFPAGHETGFWWAHEGLLPESRFGG
jgi:hypothetical protein